VAKAMEKSSSSAVGRVSNPVVATRTLIAEGLKR
jgi:hypothetical protein